MSPTRRLAAKIAKMTTKRVDARKTCWTVVSLRGILEEQVADGAPKESESLH